MRASWWRRQCSPSPPTSANGYPEREPQHDHGWTIHYADLADVQCHQCQHQPRHWRGRGERLHAGYARFDDSVSNHGHRSRRNATGFGHGHSRQCSRSAAHRDFYGEPNDHLARTVIHSDLADYKRYCGYDQRDRQRAPERLCPTEPNRDYDISTHGDWNWRFDARIGDRPPEAPEPWRDQIHHFSCAGETPLPPPSSTPE